MITFFNSKRIPNWNRIWIFQEMVLASRLALMAGSETISWDAVDVFLMMVAKIYSGKINRPSFAPSESFTWTYLTHPAHFGQHTRSGHNIQWFRHICKFEWQCGLPFSDGISDPEFVESLYWVAIKRAATDPRDIVYAVMQLVHWDIIPDYSLSVREVYCQFARHITQKTKRLFILMHSGLGWNYPDGWGLPSFVPNLHALLNATTNSTSPA
jgi:hypothetical protein